MLTGHRFGSALGHSVCPSLFALKPRNGSSARRFALSPSLRSSRLLPVRPRPRVGSEVLVGRPSVRGGEVSQALLVTFVVGSLVIGGVGCSSASSSRESRPPGTSSARPAGGLAVNSGGPPGVCAQLANSRVLTDLGQTLPDLVSISQTADARSTTRTVVATLKRLDASAPVSLRPAMRRVEAALSAVATGAPNDAQVSELAAAFDAFGTAVQAQCHFPLK
jgi:hypothetical protein